MRSHLGVVSRDSGVAYPGYMSRPDPSLYQPRLTPWGHTWRLLFIALISFGGLLAVDSAEESAHQRRANRTSSFVVEHMGVTVYSESRSSGDTTDRPVTPTSGNGSLFTLVPDGERLSILPSNWVLPVELIAGAVAFVLVWYRRRWPVVVAVTLTLLSVVAATVSGPLMLAYTSLTTRRRWKEIVPLFVLQCVASTAANWFEPEMGWTVVGAVVGVGALHTAIGISIGSRRELEWSEGLRRQQEFDEQHMRVQQAQMSARQAQLAQRQQIAREMHDVLAHRISRISMQSGAMSFREDLTPDELRVGMQAIREQSTEALAELRSVLGVLRDEASMEPLRRPQPTVASIPELLDEVGRNGQRVNYSAQLDSPIGDHVGRAVYRIIQEGLTNAHKHAYGTTVTINIVSDAETGVYVSMTNPLSVGAPRTKVPGVGFGLIGMRERVAALGGQFVAEARGNIFAVEVNIPMTDTPETVVSEGADNDE